MGLPEYGTSAPNKWHSLTRTRPSRRCGFRSLWTKRQQFRGTTMKQPIVRFPVLCPRCGVESLAEVSVDLAAEALMRNEGIQLKSACHNLYWTASPAEMQQLREYMSAGFFDEQRTSSSPTADRISIPSN